MTLNKLDFFLKFAEMYDFSKILISMESVKIKFSSKIDFTAYNLHRDQSVSMIVKKNEKILNQVAGAS